MTCSAGHLRDQFKQMTDGFGFPPHTNTHNEGLDAIVDVEVLIVLDNCEHFIDAAVELAERIMNAFGVSPREGRLPMVAISLRPTSHLQTRCHTFAALNSCASEWALLVQQPRQMISLRSSSASKRCC